MVGLLTICRNSRVQRQMCQITLLLNTAYLLTVSPYYDPEHAKLDQVNCFFLLVLNVLQSTYSAWNTDTNVRFKYGMGFDALVVLQFVMNLLIILRQVFTSLNLKLKQRLYRYKHLNRGSTNSKRSIDKTKKSPNGMTFEESKKNVK